MAFTTAGKQWIIDKVQDVAPSSNAKMQYVGWGTGTTAENVADTALVTESAETRVSGTLSQPAADTDRLVGTITSASGQSIAEVGRFNAVTTGVMQQRHKFTALPLQTGDSIEFTIDHQQT